MIHPPNVLAIIPARGGSKGIPKKNLLPLAGRPLLEYTLDQVLAVPAVSRVVVSTDDGEISQLAEACGAEVVRRPAALSDDRASSESALLHCLDHLKDGEDYDPDVVVFLQATSPLRSPRHIEEAISVFERENADSLFSAGPLRGLAWRMEGKTPVPVSYDPYHRMRRQDTPEYLAENGSIYLFKPWVLRDLGSRIGGKIAVYKMHALDSFEVDEKDDVPIVDYLLRSRYPDLVDH